MLSRTRREKKKKKESLNLLRWYIKFGRKYQIDIEEVVDKIQWILTIKILSKWGAERKHLNIIKIIYQNLLLRNSAKEETLEHLLRSATTKVCLFTMVWMSLLMLQKLQKQFEELEDKSCCALITIHAIPSLCHKRDSELLRTIFFFFLVSNNGKNYVSTSHSGKPQFCSATGKPGLSKPVL